MRDWRLGSRAFLVRSIGELEVIAFVYIESAVLYTFDRLGPSSLSHNSCGSTFGFDNRSKE